MASINLASKFAAQVDERFTMASQAEMALNNKYEFNGVDTVKVYSIPIAPVNDYQRSGMNRFGTPADLTRNVQTMKIKNDKSFTFIIDKGDKLQAQMVMDAGQALARQLREVILPMFDTYVFKTLAATATARGNYSTAEITNSNAYEMFLNAGEKLSNAGVPDTGRIAFCSYRFANQLTKLDNGFVRYGDKSQDMLIKGVIGEVDGVKIVRVASSRLPAGCAFIMTHAEAAVGPKQLEDYRTHDDPVGISGWLCEGRFIFDCFVLDEKADAVYYHGSQPVLKALNVTTAATDVNKSTIIVPAALEGESRKYVTAVDAASLPEVKYDTVFSGGTALTSNSLEIPVTNSHTVVMVVELDSAGKPIASGVAKLNVG